MSSPTRTTLVTSAILIAIIGAGVAYTAWMARIEPRAESYTRVRDLTPSAGKEVTVKGIAGRRIEGGQAGVRRYTLYDDYGQAAIVHTMQDWPIIGITYVIRGVVESLAARSDPVIVERQRRLWRLEPSAARGGFAKIVRWINSIEGGSTMGILIGLLLVGIGFIIAGFVYLRSVSPIPEAYDQPNRAPETEWLPPPAPTVAPAPARPRDTLEAWGRLNIAAGPDQGKSFPVVGNKVMVGRDSSDVVLADDTISRQHCYLIRTNDGRIVYVDQSRNGSIVNGKSLHMGQTEIANGTKVEIGMTLMEFHQFYVGAAPAGEARPSRRPTAQIELPHTAASRRPTEAMGVEVAAVGGPDSGKRYPVRLDVTTIGRGEDRDIQLTDESVSRVHATIRFENGGFVIHDDGSSHGTQVNSERVSSKTLKNGDTVSLGRTTLRFEQRG